MIHLHREHIPDDKHMKLYSWIFSSIGEDQVGTIQLLHISFYKQLNFQSQPRVANDFSQNEAESCLQVATFLAKISGSK